MRVPEFRLTFISKTIIIFLLYWGMAKLFFLFCPEHGTRANWEALSILIFMVNISFAITFYLLPVRSMFKGLRRWEKEIEEKEKKLGIGKWAQRTKISTSPPTD